MDTQTTEQAIAEVWKLFKETDVQFKETDARMDRRFAEMDRRQEQGFAEMRAEIAKSRQETDRRLAEIRAEIAESNKERDAKLDQRFAETSAEIAKNNAEIIKINIEIAKSHVEIAKNSAEIAKSNDKIAKSNIEIAKNSAEIAKSNIEISKTNKALRRFEGLFSNQWGRLIEALVQPGVLKLFQDRGHDVQRLHQRSKAKMNGSNMEIDIILENQIEVIPVEVKTTLTVERVNEFLDDLAEFTRFFPIYKTYRIYGAVAALDIPLDVSRYAYRKGLFVVSITGDDLVQIENDEKFRPKDFGPQIAKQRK